MEKWVDITVACVFRVVTDSLLPHVEFGQNHLREDAPHFN